MRLVPDAGDAEELVVRTLARAVEKIAQFRDGTNLGAWLRAILLNELRRDRRRAAPLADPAAADRPDAAPGPDERAAARSDGEALAAALARLPERLRTVVVLHYYEERPLADIARLLRIPLGTVKFRLHDARARETALPREHGRG